MILSTTSIIEGRKIIEYRGLVAGESVHKVKFKASDLSLIEAEIAENRKVATEKMIANAIKLKAAGIIGVKYNYEALDEMLLVSVQGTAVIFEWGGIC